MHFVCYEVETRYRPRQIAFIEIRLYMSILYMNNYKFFLTRTIFECFGLIRNLFANDASTFYSIVQIILLDNHCI